MAERGGDDIVTKLLQLIARTIIIFRNTTASSEKNWVLFQGFKPLKQLLNGPSSSLPPENVRTGRTESVELRTDSPVQFPPGHSSFKRYKKIL